MLALFAALSLLNGSFPASSDDWVTIQDGQFHLGEEPFFPMGSNYFDNEAYFLSRIESGVNVFRLSASWLDFPETDDTIYNVFGIEEGKSGAKLEAGFRLAEERGVFLL